MNDHASRRSATLAIGPDRAEENRLGGHFDVGGRRDDQRIVAAELHDRFAEAAVDCLRDVQSHRDRAGCGNKRNTRIVR